MSTHVRSFICIYFEITKVAVLTGNGQAFLRSQNDESEFWSVGSEGTIVKFSLATVRYTRLCYIFKIDFNILCRVCLVDNLWFQEKDDPGSKMLITQTKFV